MSKLVKLGASLLLCATFANATPAGEAEALVKAGADYCKKVGVEACVEEFNKPESAFVKGDLYIWANDFDGVLTAHPKKPIKGKNLIGYKDKAGTLVFKMFIDQIKSGKEGWSNDYYWAHPTTGEQTLKTSYIMKISDNQLIGAGIYK